MVNDYIASNKDRFLAELFDWLRIPSVSADSRHKGDVRKAAEFLKKKFEDAGVDCICRKENQHFSAYHIGLRTLRRATCRSTESLGFTALRTGYQKR